MAQKYKTLGSYPGRFSGVKVHNPDVGDIVEVLEGDSVGEHLEVVAVEGWVYSLGYRIYVRTHDGIPTWYWPWNLKVIEQGKTKKERS